MQPTMQAGKAVRETATTGRPASHQHSVRLRQTVSWLRRASHPRPPTQLANRPLRVVRGVESGKRQQQRSTVRTHYITSQSWNVLPVPLSTGLCVLSPPTAKGRIILPDATRPRAEVSRNPRYWLDDDCFVPNGSVGLPGPSLTHGPSLKGGGSSGSRRLARATRRAPYVPLAAFPTNRQPWPLGGGGYYVAFLDRPFARCKPTTWNGRQYHILRYGIGRS